MTLANTLLPLFGLIALGFAAVRLRWVPAEGVAPMGAVVVRLALPALIFLTLAQAPPAETINPALLAAYAAGTVATMGLCLLAARALALPAAASATVLLGVALANSGFLGLPVTQALFDAETAGRVLAHCLLVENVLVIPAGLAALALAQGQRAGGLALWAGLVRNPLLVALAAGLAVAALGLALPPPLRTGLEMLARLSAPLALLVIGGMLAGLTATGGAAAVGLLALGKLVIHPAATWAALALVPGPVPPALATGAVIFAAMPMVTIFPLLAARDGQGQMAAMGLLVATLGSFATLPVVIILLGLA